MLGSVREAVRESGSIEMTVETGNAGERLNMEMRGRIDAPAVD